MLDLPSYPRTLHLDGSGLGDGKSPRPRLSWSSVQDENVVLEEKMDGSETSFEFDDDANPVLRFRGTPLDLMSRGGAERPFDRFKDWFTLHQDAFFDRLDARYRVYGEWLFATHRIFYDRLPDYFLEFDIFEKKTGRFLDTPGRRALLGGLGMVHSVRVIYEGAAGAITHPSSLGLTSAFRSAAVEVSAARACDVYRQDHGAFLSRIDRGHLMEGIYGKVEKDGMVTARFKWVRPDFVESIVKGGRHWRDLPLVPNLLEMS